MQPRAVTVEFGPSRSKRFAKASAYHLKEMAWCASAQLKNWGICRFRYVYGIMPRCSLCPLFDVERAIRDILGENPPPSIDLEINLGPNLRAALRGEIPLGEDREPPVVVPDFVPDEWKEPKEPPS